jgi:3-deoxy-manno-octulosonate cytidylyltransferase (CMP-KDO synthetase)
MASSRFPGKPLECMLGMPLILHVMYRCALEDHFDDVIVATCDREIMECVENANGVAVMTASTHERCTDRVFEAIEAYPTKLKKNDLVIMVQGDEVLVNPDMLKSMINIYESSQVSVINLISRIYREEDHDDVNVVKVVTDLNERITYLSRAAIPSRSRNSNAPMYQQTGVIAYSSRFLNEFSKLKQTPLEIIESIDMLRLIENGISLRSLRTELETISVDTKNDLIRAEKALINDVWTKKYCSIN